MYVDDLTDKQKMFCREYLVDLNATQAAIRAGYSQKTARSIAQENLTKPDIGEYIQQLMKERSDRTNVTADKVIQEIAKMAFFNMQDVLDENGAMKSLEEWEREDLAAVQEIVEDVVKTEDDGSQVLKRKIKLSDKKSNLEMLGKHLKIFTNQIDHNHSFQNMTDEELDSRIRQAEQQLNQSTQD